jgi:hypothetical protein
MVKLYEFRDPIEQKYGNDLSENEKIRLVRTVVLPSEWEPYPEKPARVENICGRLVKVPEERDDSWDFSKAGPPLDFDEPGDDKAFNEDISQVCFRKFTPFGAQNEVYHLNGHVTIRNVPGLPKSVSFKGIRGFSAARELISDMMYPEETTSVSVHMGVIGLNLGKRIQTSPGCYLENRVYDRLAFLNLGSRTIDTCNTVRLVVKNWDQVGLDQKLRPLTNDLLITGKGSMMHRYTWKSMEWTQENEAKVLAATQWVADMIYDVV